MKEQRIINVKSILQCYLHVNEYDGLVRDGGKCSCSLDDLMPCSKKSSDCVPAILDDAGNLEESPNCVIELDGVE